jgi:hypothetical protein
MLRRMKIQSLMARKMKVRMSRGKMITQILVTMMQMEIKKSRLRKNPPKKS